MSKLDNRRTEVFVTKDDSCYFINNRAILNKKKINESMKIESMLHSIPSLDNTDDIAKAIEIFLNYKVNAIPVLIDGKIVGEIQILSILEKMKEGLLSKITLDELKLNHLQISYQKSLSSARKKLKENQLDALLVKKDNIVAQVITSNDIVGILNPPQRVGTRGTIGKTKVRSLEPQIGNIGTKVFPRCAADACLDLAVKSMINRKTRYCVIDFSSTKQFILTAHDIISLFYKRTSKKIPIYVVGSKSNNIFGRSISRLESPLKIFSKKIDEILEARISIKEQRKSGLETKFHLKLLLITSKEQLVFSSKTWSIDEGLSSIADMITGKVSSSKKRMSKKSIRKTSKSEILAK